LPRVTGDGPVLVLALKFQSRRVSINSFAQEEKGLVLFSESGRNDQIQAHKNGQAVACKTKKQ